MIKKYLKESTVNDFLRIHSVTPGLARSVHLFVQNKTDAEFQGELKRCSRKLSVGNLIFICFALSVTCFSFELVQQNSRCIFTSGVNQLIAENKVKINNNNQC